ncbi:FUSC family protein [Fictibacillus barbaricus]|uniref:Aromatic acid exporter family protein n=1 Tax=Fictibacillus barbaricus TaxID=182136 RepID=A0ABS2Z865_9BACL|nr:aromatic acid exporter family protein [Fictibacillus barbaricus]MBN3543781.1 aromatic acid exporter family protein [Fictibacillus barbaricus]
MKLGARMIKTGLAISLSIYLAMLFQLDQPVYAAIAATFAIQPSIYRSYQTILEQVQGNLVGALFAIIFVILLGNNPFVIGFVVVLVIAAHLKMKIEKTIPLSIVTVIVIMESHTENFIGFAVDRFLLIMLGVLSAFLVNLVFMPPKYETKLYYKISDHTDEIIKWIRMITRHASEHSAIKEDLTHLKENRFKMDQYYLLYKEERTYFRSNKYSKTRKLVLYRQMIHTTNKALELLKSLHSHENELYNMPEPLQELIQLKLDGLTNFHEQMLLKYTDKIRAQHTLEMDAEINKKALMKCIMTYYNSPENEEWIELFPVFALIIDYSDQLEHLNTLVESFKNYHQDDSEVQLDQRLEN